MQVPLSPCTPLLLIPMDLVTSRTIVAIAYDVILTQSSPVVPAFFDLIVAPHQSPRWAWCDQQRLTRGIIVGRSSEWADGRKIKDETSYGTKIDGPPPHRPGWWRKGGRAEARGARACQRPRVGVHILTRGGLPGEFSVEKPYCSNSGRVHRGWDRRRSLVCTPTARPWCPECRPPEREKGGSGQCPTLTGRGDDHPGGVFLEPGSCSILRLVLARERLQLPLSMQPPISPTSPIGRPRSKLWPRRQSNQTPYS